MTDKTKHEKAQRQSGGTTVANSIFVVCMLAFIAFIVWQYGMHGNPDLGVTQNAHEPAATAPKPQAN